MRFRPLVLRTGEGFYTLEKDFARHFLPISHRHRDPFGVIFKTTDCILAENCGTLFTPKIRQNDWWLRAWMFIQPTMVAPFDADAHSFSHFSHFISFTADTSSQSACTRQLQPPFITMIKFPGSMPNLQCSTRYAAVLPGNGRIQLGSRLHGNKRLHFEDLSEKRREHCGVEVESIVVNY